MKTSDFDYYLPSALIAQTPVEPRDQSRLMVLNRSDGSIRHHHFSEITDFFRNGDILVLNNSRVIPARLYGQKINNNTKIELLLLRQLDKGIWETLIKPGKRAGIGTRIEIRHSHVINNSGKTSVLAEVIGAKDGGIKIISFSDEMPLAELGEVPLPPYIHTPLTDPSRYQTVYASVRGSVAAPTAGLHFTAALLDRIAQRGVQTLFVTLHIGLDTFRPVREEDPFKHPIHEEYGILSKTVASQLSQAKMEKRRVICAGTSTARILEQAAQKSAMAPVEAYEGWANLFILPGYKFRVTDTLITNFHLPRSTLLMLVAAFTGQELINHAYQEAITSRYRFYSFGDAMLVL